MLQNNAQTMARFLATMMFIVMTAALYLPVSAEESLLHPPGEVEMIDHGGSHIYQKWFENIVGKDWSSYETIHMRVLVRELQKRCKLSIYYYWDGNRSKHGGGMGVTINQPGDNLTVSNKLSSLWHSHPVNWSNIGPKWRIQIRDGKSIQFKPVDEQRTYLPIKYHLTVVMVKKGSTFSGWENYPINGVSIAPHHATFNERREKKWVVVSSKACPVFTVDGRLLSTRRFAAHARVPLLFRHDHDNVSRIIVQGDRR